MNTKYIIIGNGIAGITAAETIRKLDSEGNITMISAEHAAPYCRPMISLLLEGAITPDRLNIRSKKFYNNLNIQSVIGEYVASIDVENKSVSTQNGKNYAFDKLLIATGADPRPVKAKCLNLKNIFFMRTEKHVRQMLEVLPDAKRALVLGGGLVGFKAAYGLMKQGLDVTMLIGSGYPLSMQVDEFAGKMILDKLLSHGLKVRVGIKATSFEGREKVSEAHLSDGTSIKCDLVVIGKGVLPALSFVPRKHIDVDLGILVDEHLESSFRGIYAAGDVAEFIDIARKSRWVNAIWPEAAAQGCIAGMNMSGRPVAYKGSLSRNIIRIFDMDLMTAGLVNPPPNNGLDNGYEIFKSFDWRLNIYRKVVVHDNKLVGMVLLNNIEQGGILLSLIQNEISLKISPQAMLDSSFNYRKLMI